MFLWLVTHFEQSQLLYGVKTGGTLENYLTTRKQKFARLTFDTSSAGTHSGEMTAI